MKLCKHDEICQIERLIPQPRNVEPLGGHFRFTQTTEIMVETGGSDRAEFAADRLASLIDEEFGLQIKIYKHSEEMIFQIILRNSPETDVEPENMVTHTELGSEGYILEVTPEAAWVQAPTPEGLFNGAMTLRQLIAEETDEENDEVYDEVYVHGARISDWPRYEWRGFQIDSGRSPNSLAKIKRIIRICSAFKFNFMLFREGDDELSAVRYESNKLGSRNPYAFTMDQVREMIDYAEQYGITVVPEIESLGHSTAKGFDYPDLIAGGFEQEYGDLVTHIRKSHLLPADERSYKLLESVYREWFEVMRTPFVHLGLDEVRLEAEPQAKHLEGLLGTINCLADEMDIKITPIVWADAPPTPEDYAGQVIRCLWHYGGTEHKVNCEYDHLIKQGLRELSKKGCEEKVFMAAGAGSGHTPYSKTDYEGSFENSAQWAMWGADKPNFIGMLSVQWSGNMTDRWLPDFLASADCAWNPPDEAPEFKPQFETIKWQLSRIHDAANPAPSEVDPPAWDGIFLRGNEWQEDIMTGKKAAE